jgi:hypothetical protein
MARLPAGPIGNSPRDVRDDAIGVPADDIKAPEPPRWPRKPTRVTKNTFHAKVSGGSSPARADRKPHFRRGGFVSGFASGGSIEKKMEKREEEPGEQKNDPFAKQNLKRGGVAKRQGGGGIKPDVEPLKIDPRGPLGTALSRTRPLGTYKGIKVEEERLPKNEPGYKAGGVAKRADGGKLSAAQRQSLPKSDFALPGKGEGPKGAGSGSYPIPDESHAVDALARSSGKPVAAKVRAKVEAKYPGIGQK